MKTTIVNNLYKFYKLFVASDFSDRVHAPHIKKLSDQLMRIYMGEYGKLCVAMPPRHSKSSMVTLAYPLWLIFRNPDLNILIINNTATLSEKFGIQLREYVKKYGNLFNVYLSDVKHSSSHLMFEDDEGELYNGSIRLQGANGSITGQDADYLIIDDPYKGFEDITPSLLEKKIDWFKSMIIQRLEPQTKLIILHTRWHTLDLQGYLKENYNDQYRFLSFPAISDEGEPLWKQRYSIDMLRQKEREMGERLFQSIYQQKPIDLSSDFFRMETIRFEPYESDGGVVPRVRAWDIASSEAHTKNDYTAGILMEKHGDIAVIKGLKHGQYGNHTKAEIQSTARTDTATTMIGIETGVAAAGKLLFQEWKNQLPGYNVRQAQPFTSKEDRATPLANAVYDGKVYIDVSDNERERIMREMSTFPLGEHDDIVDAMAHAYNILFEQRTKNTKIGVVHL